MAKMPKISIWVSRVIQYEVMKGGRTTRMRKARMKPTSLFLEPNKISFTLPSSKEPGGLDGQDNRHGSE